MLVPMISSPPEDGRLSPGLYIVATPIGNLSDLSPRAAAILARADLIAVEDSRVTAKLLGHIGARRPMVPYHDHNADRVRPGLVARLGGEAIALVSDAGTPLISDPGFKLVRDARAAGHAVVTIPGPCADAIAEVAGIKATLILYESGPRLSATLAALAEGLGDREAAVAREISKKFEECVTDSLSALSERYADAPPKGEIVVIVGPPGEAPAPSAEDADSLLADALKRLPAAKAAHEVAKATGLNKRDLYARALDMKG
jgi:16S rRNA (cytidine1402-2'-O)-methyltransferase